MMAQQNGGLSNGNANGAMNGDDCHQQGAGPMDGLGQTGMDKMDSMVPKKAARRKSRKSMVEEEPDELAKLPKIKEQTKLEDRMKLALKKMELCQRIFNFHDPDMQISSKEAKQLALEELLDFLRTMKGAITEKFYSEIFTLVSVNIFRDLPPREDERNPFDFELAQQSGPENENEFGNCQDPAWAHLEVIYEILLQFFGSLEFRATLAKKFVDQNFVQKLIGLFQSEDPRERQFLTKIVKKIYAKFIRLRIFIRKQICNTLLAFLYEQGQQMFCGVSELLDILQCVVDDFRVPLKEESKGLLHKIILPLHKPDQNGFALFYAKLADRVVQFVELDPSLTKIVIDNLLKYWPTTSCTREVHFVEEVERILKVTELEEFRKNIIPLFGQIAKCIGSSHSQVAYRSLQLWKEEGRILVQLKEGNGEIVPLIFSQLCQTADGHWHKNVQKLAKDVQNILAERNWKLWNRLMAAGRDESPVEFTFYL